MEWSCLICAWWTFKTCQVKEAKHKDHIFFLFHLYEMARISKSIDRKYISGSLLTFELIFFLPCFHGSCIFLPCSAIEKAIHASCVWGESVLLGMSDYLADLRSPMNCCKLWFIWLFFVFRLRVTRFQAFYIQGGSGIPCSIIFIWIFHKFHFTQNYFRSISLSFGLSVKSHHWLE